MNIPFRSILKLGFCDRHSSFRFQELRIAMAIRVPFPALDFLGRLPESAYKVHTAQSSFCTILKSLDFDAAGMCQVQVGGRAPKFAGA